MRRVLFGRYAAPFVALGGLAAVACLASTWYINRLQAGLARAVRHDAARLAAADELQFQIRTLRFHSLMVAAEPSGHRRALLDTDHRLVLAALADARRECDEEDDLRLLAVIERGYHGYEEELGFDADRHLAGRSGGDLIRWADAHPVRGLLAPCRELENRQRDRMARNLERSEDQTTWAGRALFGLGAVGALGGLLAGYATARRRR